MRVLIPLFATALLIGAAGCSKRDDTTAPADQQPMPASPTTPGDAAPPVTPESTPTPSEAPPPGDTTEAPGAMDTAPSETPSDTTTPPNP